MIFKVGDRVKYVPINSRVLPSYMLLSGGKGTILSIQNNGSPRIRLDNNFSYGFSTNPLNLQLLDKQLLFSFMYED